LLKVHSHLTFHTPFAFQIFLHQVKGNDALWDLAGWLVLLWVSSLSLPSVLHSVAHSEVLTSPETIWTLVTHLSTKKSHRIVHHEFRKKSNDSTEDPCLAFQMPVQALQDQLLSLKLYFLPWLMKFNL
jgi:hypothetical protein